MQNKKSKTKDAITSGSVLFTDSLLEVGSTIASDALKESVTHIVGELAIDTFSSFIPGISGAVSSFKRKRAEKNILAFVEHLHNDRELLLQNLHNQTEENRLKIDEMMHHVFDHVINESQVEKVEYMANGFFSISEHKNFTEDFVLLYYDILKQLRMVDISVLKLYYNNFHGRFIDLNSTQITYQDIMNKHDLSYEQYASVRENLVRMGLLKVRIEDSIENDLNTLSESIIELKEYFDKQLQGKRAKRLQKPKLKNKEKEKLELNKFGQEFYKFFGNVKKK